MLGFALVRVQEVIVEAFAFGVAVREDVIDGREEYHFADRLAVVEGSRLDPTHIGNVAFAAQMRGRPSSASVPTTLLRGRYQRMVPPQMMASPAPA